MKIKKSNRVSQTTSQTTMSKLSCDTFLSIAKSRDDTWYVLIMGDALCDGLISSSYIQKFKKVAKSFKMRSCKIRVLLADSQLDVSMKGKERFTPDEVEVYIDTWKVIKGMKNE